MRKIISFLSVLTMTMMLLSGCSPKVYSVQFDPNGGNRDSGRFLQEIEAGQRAIEPQVSREGYVFNGWDQSFDKIEGNLVVKAQWIKQVTVTFDGDEGMILQGNPVQVLLEGELPEEPTFVRVGYDFIGWDKAIKEVGQEDVTYTAQWKETVYSAEQIYDMLDESVVEVTVYDSDYYKMALGSGFFIDDKGTLVTNYHVIEGAYFADVTFYDGTIYDVAEVLGFDPGLDIAILRIDIPVSVPIKIAERQPVTGQTVYALGSSEGLTGTFSQGIVSTISRVVDGKECVQITAPISHGNSGGPCVNEYCEVIGINSMMYHEGQNLNFAIKIHEIDKISLDNPMTMDEVYTLMGFADYTATYASVLGGPGVCTIVDTGDEGMGVYDDADYVEWEPNDDLDICDSLLNGSWSAGYLDIDKDDLDVFSVYLDTKSDLYVYILPYWVEDTDLIDAAVAKMNDKGELELAGTFEIVNDSTEGYQMATLKDLPAGQYFVVMMAAENYTYPVGPYYWVTAEWEPAN